MSFATAYRIYCDGVVFGDECCSSETDHSTKEQARDQARSRGWKLTKNGDYCSQHVDQAKTGTK